MQVAGNTAAQCCRIHRPQTDAFAKTGRRRDSLQSRSGGNRDKGGRVHAPEPLQLSMNAMHSILRPSRTPPAPHQSAVQHASIMPDLCCTELPI